MAIANWYSKLAAAAMLLAASTIQAQTMPPAPSDGLGTTNAPNLLEVVPPAPVAGDPRDLADRAIFRTTRTAENSPRWTLAQHDADYSVPGLLRAVACALGSAPDDRNAPRLTALLVRAIAECNLTSGSVKERYRRKRPFLVDDGPICVARDAFMVSSFDYPSGHSTLGWATGLILAELEPDRASDILARARAYGDSRIFCGVHTASAVEAGRIVAASVVATLNGSPAFRAEMQAAGKELAALRKAQGPDQASCKLETQLVDQSPYSAHPGEPR